MAVGWSCVSQVHISSVHLFREQCYCNSCLPPSFPWLTVLFTVIIQLTDDLPSRERSREAHKKQYLIPRLTGSATLWCSSGRSHVHVGSHESGAIVVSDADPTPPFLLKWYKAKRRISSRARIPLVPRLGLAIRQPHVLDYLRLWIVLQVK